MHREEGEVWGKKGKRGQPAINCVSFSWVTAADLIKIFNRHLGLKRRMATSCKIRACSESSCLHRSLVLYQTRPCLGFAELAKKTRRHPNVSL